MSAAAGWAWRRHAPEERRQQRCKDEGDHDGTEGIGIGQRRGLAVRELKQLLQRSRMSVMDSARMARVEHTPPLV